MFEKFKAKEALSHLEGTTNLTFNALAPRAAQVIFSEAEWALNAYAYMYYSAPSATTAANLLTACCCLSLCEEISDDTEFPSFTAQAKDALKYLEKCYIYDKFDRPEHYTALVQGYTVFGSAQKALGVEYNTPEEMRQLGAKFFAAVLAFESGEDADLGIYSQLSGEPRYALEYAFAQKNDYPEENLVSIAQNERDLIILTDVFGRLNAAGRSDIVEQRAADLLERDLDDVIYGEIVYALFKRGNTALLNKFNEIYTGELYKAGYEAITSGEDIDRTQRFRNAVQDEIDELVSSSEYQNADNATKAFLNHQIREAIMNEAENEDVNLLRSVPCFIVD